MELNNKKQFVKWLLYAKLIKVVVFLVVFFFFQSCTVSYKLNGASIDYTKTKSIAISDFPNISELIYPPLAQEFAETLRDTYAKQTRLQLLKKGGDMNLEGEITAYQLTPLAISADSYAAETKLSMTVKVRFRNNKNPQDDFEKNYTAYQTFDSNRLLSEVQDELMKIMVKEIADNIYNDTVAKW